MRTLSDGFRQAADAIPNWDTAELGPFYYGLVLALRPRLIVETGIYHGGTTVWLARAAREVTGACVISVDIEPESCARAEQNLWQLGLDECVELVAGDACAVLTAQSAIGLCVLDDDHRYEQVAAELRIAWERLAPGGIVLGHDALNSDHSGVRDAFADFAQEVGISPIWLPASCGVCLLQKPCSAAGVLPMYRWRNGAYVQGDSA